MRGTVLRSRYHLTVNYVDGSMEEWLIINNGREARGRNFVSDTDFSLATTSPNPLILHGTASEEGRTAYEVAFMSIGGKGKMILCMDKLDDIQRSVQAREQREELERTYQTMDGTQLVAQVLPPDPRTVDSTTDDPDLINYWLHEVEYDA